MMMMYKKIQMMYNLIAHHPLTDARPPLPKSRLAPPSRQLPGLYSRYDFLWWEISH